MLLKAPKGCGGVSHGGQSYPVIDGMVKVPDEAAAELTQPGWGFTPAQIEQPKTENRKPKTGT